MPSNKLSLRRETLTELTTDELAVVAGGMVAPAVSWGGRVCVTIVIDWPGDSCVAVSCITN